MEPWLAIVVDPFRTISTGKVDLGCFRTMPDGVINEDMLGPQGIPADKVADFGNHAHEYYKIPHSIFKSSLDNTLFESLFSSYWAQTLS